MHARLAATAVALGALGALASFAAPAGASTAGCHTSGAFAGYCGTQANGNDLAINVKQNVAKSGQPIVGYSSKVVTPGSDFVWQAIGDGSGNKEAIYAPGGMLAVSNGQYLCLSDPEQAGAAALQLRYCNGSKFQAWNNDGVTGAWLNANDGKAISQSTTTGNQLTMVAAPTASAPATAWTFTS